MRNFFISFYEMTEDGFLGWIGFILLSLVGLAVSVVVIFGILYIIDCSFMPLKEGNGIVTNKQYHSAYTTTTFIQSGKIMVPITEFHPERYEVDIEVNGLEDDVLVSATEYLYIIHPGLKVHATYTNGRIWNSLYIKSISY